MTLSLSDRILNNTLDIESFANSTSNELVDILAEGQLRAIQKFKSAGANAAFTKKFLSDAINELSETFNKLKPEYQSVLTAAQRELIKAEYESVAKSLVSFSLDEDKARVITKLTTKKLQALVEAPLGGKSLSKWVNSGLANVAKGVKRELGVQLAANATIEQASKALREAAFGLTRNQANILTRTTFLDSAQRARNRLYKDNSDVITGYQYLATLDGRTCPICAPNDRVVAKTIEELPMVPRHPRCRCVIIPLTALSDPEEPRPAVTDAEEKKVHHKDGSTSTKFKPIEAQETSKNFSQFFESQPAAWKEQWLGPKRYELWKNGQLTDLRVLARNERVLTLDELKKNLLGETIAKTEAKIERVVERVEESLVQAARDKAARQAAEEGEESAKKIAQKKAAEEAAAAEALQEKKALEKLDKEMEELAGALTKDRKIYDSIHSGPVNGVGSADSFREWVGERTSALTDKEIDQMRYSISRYTGGSFQEFTTLDRLGQDTDAGNIRWINWFLDNGPKYNTPKAKLYRGMRFGIKDELGRIFSEQMEPGFEFELEQFSSFSSKKRIAYKFAGERHSRIQVVLEIEDAAKIQRQGSIKALSNVKTEEEVLVGKGTRFRVKKIERETIDVNVFEPEGTKLIKVVLEVVKE